MMPCIRNFLLLSVGAMFLASNSIIDALQLYYKQSNESLWQNRKFYYLTTWPTLHVLRYGLDT